MPFFSGTDPVKLCEKKDYRGILRVLQSGSDAQRLLMVRIFAVDAIYLNIDTLDLRERPEFDGPLISCLSDRNVEVRKFAAKALGMRKASQALQPLFASLRNDKNEDVRVQAAFSLGSICDVQAVDELIKALSDPSATVRSCSAVALGNIGDKRAVMPLFAASELHSHFVSLPYNYKAYSETRNDFIPPIAHALWQLEKPDLAIEAAIRQMLRWDWLHDYAFWLRDHGYSPIADDLAAATYYVCLQDLESCARVGALVIEPLMALAKQDVIDRFMLSAFVQVGEAAVKPLIILLEDTKSLKEEQRILAALALGRLYHSGRLSADARTLIISRQNLEVGIGEVWKGSGEDADVERYRCLLKDYFAEKLPRYAFNESHLSIRSQQQGSHR